ncbi:hypothetical protein MTP99_018297 [Tenebrio molitor]|nr:hypothetical protein MTP99_018297 [Tenebrio molitor]
MCADICKNVTKAIKFTPYQHTMGESATEALDGAPQLQATKLVRKRRMERALTNNNGPDYALHNNNNHVKNERLSPGTPDVSSRSRSVTPSSHPNTPPAPDSHPLAPVSGRNYSDFMRSLAAKYNNTNPNDYFSAARNGFPPPLDPRFKPSNFPMLPLPKEGESSVKKSDFTSLLNPFANASMFPPLIDMSTTQTLLAMVRTAKEAELQGLLKSVKRQDASSPLDLSAAAPPPKRPRVKTSSSSSPSTASKRAQSESPRLHDDVSSWTVDDVCNFVSSIDICAEYAQVSTFGSCTRIIITAYFTRYGNESFGDFDGRTDRKPGFLSHTNHQPTRVIAADLDPDLQKLVP